MAMKELRIIGLQPLRPGSVVDAEATKQQVRVNETVASYVRSYQVVKYAHWKWPALAWKQ
jgi:hypothetical protein